MIASVPPIEALRATFVAMLPRIVSRGEFVFHRVKCPHRRADYLAEMLALCWSWLVRLAQQGRDGTRFVSALSAFAARQVWSGRRLSGGENSKDVLSGRARRRHGFRVEPLLSTRRSHESRYSVPLGQQAQDSFEERLRDNAVTPPPDAVAFKLDFACWLQTLTDRDRGIIGDMILDERTTDLARKFGVSAGRISQLRREYLQDWRAFCGEEE